MGDIFATEQVNMREIRCFSFISNLFISSERVKWSSLRDIIVGHPTVFIKLYYL